MITFLQLGSFFINWQEIRFFEVMSDTHIQIITKDTVFRRINIVGSQDHTEDSAVANISAPYDIDVNLTAVSFDKVRKALLTKKRYLEV